jgi:hypothetical protein
MSLLRGERENPPKGKTPHPFRGKPKGQLGNRKTEGQNALPPNNFSRIFQKSS